MSKYARFYAILNQINASGASITKEELVKQFTDGRTASLSELSVSELGQLERNMATLTKPRNENGATPVIATKEATLRAEGTTRNTATPNTIPSEDWKTLMQRDKMRKAIISQFLSIGKTTADAIAWAEKYGVNQVKRRFNDYTTEELIILIRNAEKAKKDHITSISNALNHF